MKKSPVMVYSALLLLLGSVCSQAQQSLTATRNGDANAGSQALSNVSGTASPGQSQTATSGPIVQEQDVANVPTYSVLYTFTGGTDGASPTLAGLIGDKEGNLYGTTESGGNDTGCSSFGSPGCGVVFKLDRKGNETVLYSFCPTGEYFNCTDGQSPNAVIQDHGRVHGLELHRSWFPTDPDPVIRRVQCGQQLAPAQARQARLPLQQGAASQEGRKTFLWMRLRRELKNSPNRVVG
jgi:uncharacterized repeat protein (TIGR03803 family)